MWEGIGLIGMLVLLGGVYFITRMLGSEQARDRSYEGNGDTTSGITSTGWGGF